MVARPQTVASGPLSNVPQSRLVKEQSDSEGSPQDWWGQLKILFLDVYFVFVICFLSGVLVIIFDIV